MNNILEVCTDASLKTYPDGRSFSCSGAVLINNPDERYIVTADSTNNRGELLAIYLGIKLAEEYKIRYPDIYGNSEIYLYSDSQFSVFGLRDWMIDWSKTMDSRGIIYGSNRTPVKNQELFMMIITYCVTHNLVIHLFNQKGHVNTNSAKTLAKANEQFHTANGFYLKPEDIFKISFYNDIVDKNSRNILDQVNEDDYEVQNHDMNDKIMCRYIIPQNFKDFIK